MDFARRVKKVRRPPKLVRLNRQPCSAPLSGDLGAGRKVMGRARNPGIKVVRRAVLPLDLGMRRPRARQGYAAHAAPPIGLAALRRRRDSADFNAIRWKWGLR